MIQNFELRYFRAIKLEPTPKRAAGTIQPKPNTSSRKFTVPIVTSPKTSNGLGRPVGTPLKTKVANNSSLVKCPTSPACACNTRTCNQRGVVAAAVGSAVRNSNANGDNKRVEVSRNETKKHSYPRGRNNYSDDVTVLLSTGNDVVSKKSKEFQHSYSQCSDSTKSSRDASKTP